MKSQQTFAFAGFLQFKTYMSSNINKINSTEVSVFFAVPTGFFEGILGCDCSLAFDYQLLIYIPFGNDCRR
jgi:hypothetical protein